MRVDACGRTGFVQTTLGSLSLVILMVAMWPTTSLAQRAVEYQERSYAFEGVKPSPVSGFDIELLSARVNYYDQPDKIGDRLQIRFFLDNPRPVFLVVREIDPKYYYWLDKVKPKTEWIAGFENVFDWPTTEVIRELGGLKPNDLGIVARLDKREPSAVETVAPVLFYQSQYPTQVNGYLFTFGLRDDAKVRGVIYEETKGAIVFSQDVGRQRGGRPFTLKWDLTTAPAPTGQYRLVLSGYTLSTNDPISQIVRFIHMPMTKQGLDRSNPVK